jgi:hypothetical protein
VGKERRPCKRERRERERKKERRKKFFRGACPLCFIFSPFVLSALQKTRARVA